jgi:hypothetical protein
VSPVSTWAKLVAVLLAVGTIGITVPLVGAAAFYLVSVKVTRSIALSAPLGAGQKLVVSAGQATLELKPGPVGLVTVKVVDWTRVTSNSSLQPLQRVAATLHAMSDGQHLDVMSANDSGGNLGAEITVTVEVPADTPLEVRAGSVTADGFTGSFQISAGQGEVSLHDMTVTENSFVRAAGSVTFSGLVKSGNLELTSGFGGIEARLNRLSDARIVADTTLGEITADPWLGLTIDSSASISKHASGVMGPGTGLVTLRTGLGSIKIEFN